MRIPLDAGFQITPDVDFQEARLRKKRPDKLPVPHKRRYEGADNNVARFKEKTRRLSCPADIFLPVFYGKPQISAQAMPQLISIQQHCPASGCKEPAFQESADR